MPPGLCGPAESEQAVTASQADLAARARAIAVKAPNGSMERKASLVAAVALAEASSPAGARRILDAWDGAPPRIRQDALELIEQLATDHPGNQAGAAQEAEGDNQ